MKHFVLFISFISIVACSPQSQTLQVNPTATTTPTVAPTYAQIDGQIFNWVSEDGGQSQLDFKPQVDILFVIDNSDSMLSAQQNLKKNIDKFTRGILQNKMIDYHIGVISCWDSTPRFLDANKNNLAIGELHPVKDSQNTTRNYKNQYGDAQLVKYLTKFTAKSLIASTLDIGVTPYAQGGPEIEEFFSPLQAALDKNARGEANEGFFRENAQLVVIVMTDADDSTSNVTPQQMAQSLIDFKNKQTSLVSVYGVLVNSKDLDTNKDYDLRILPKYHPECFTEVKGQFINNHTCTGFGPTRLEEFIVSANAEFGSPEQIKAQFIKGITSKSFGTDLGNIGDDIAVKTLAKVIYLSQRPRFDEKTNQIMLKVRYGSPEDLLAGKGQLINSGNEGWLYNPDENSVHLSGKIKYNYVEGGRFAVDMIPITLAK